MNQSRCGDNWDHIALDAEHRLVLQTEPGKRSRRNVRTVVQKVKERTRGKILRLMTSDEFSAYKHEVLNAYGIEEKVKPTGRPGRPRKPRKKPHPQLLYATVHKTRKNGKVINVEERIQFGTEEMLKAALKESSVSSKVNTAFVERHNGTDRLQCSRKARKTYCFSKDWDIHNAAGYLTMYSYNFCWPVRTLRKGVAPNQFKEQTPAMSAKLAKSIWSLKEWLTLPAVFAKSS